MEKNTIEIESEKSGQEIIKKDQFGYYLEIPHIYKKQTEMYQEKFLPYFYEQYPKFKTYEECNFTNVDKPMIFSPDTVRIMTDKILPLLINESERMLKGSSENETRNLEWKESSITGILNKLLTLEAYRRERVMVSRANTYIKNTFPNDKTIKVKELCSGAGITTAMMYEALTADGKKVQMHSVDNSVQSIMCAAVLLTLWEIPTRIELNEYAHEKNFDGVTLHFESAPESIKNSKEMVTKYHIVFSDNGINYFDKTVHDETVNHMLSCVIPNGLFLDCSANPKVVTSVNKIKMMKEIFRVPKEVVVGKGEYTYQEKNGIRYAVNFFTPSTILQNEMLYAMIKKRDFSTFGKYLMGAGKTTAMAKELPTKIQEDIIKTGETVERLTNGKVEYYPANPEDSVIAYCSYVNSR